MLSDNDARWRWTSSDQWRVLQHMCSHIYDINGYSRPYIWCMCIIGIIVYHVTEWRSRFLAHHRIRRCGSVRGSDIYRMICRTLVVGTSLILLLSSVINSLVFLNVLGSIKMGATVAKYTPQVYMNWKRQCTVGFSIKQICLDMSGATLSFLQMTLIADDKRTCWGCYSVDL